MIKKGNNNYLENFETFVVNKLIEHDGKFSKIEKELERHSGILADHGGQLLTLTEKLDRIDERTAFLPKLYDICDAFMKEVIESRNERVIVGRKVSDHEERLVVVEDALAIKQPVEVY